MTTRQLGASPASVPDAGEAAASFADAAAESADPEPPQRSPRKRGRSILRRDLKCSLKDSAAFSVMVGIGETYIPAFVLALGLGEIAAGLVISVPTLVGALLQVISPWAAARLGSNKRWVVTCVLLQAGSFIPLIAAAMLGQAPLWFVFAAASLYWAGGLGAGPAWNAWMESVVPTRVRASFFAMRTRLGQAGILVGFLAGGIALQLGKWQGAALLWFAAIFGVAVLCRIVSAQYLLRQHEVPAKQSSQRPVSILQLLGRIHAGGSERMLLYFLAVQVAVQISGPYFTPYMLKQLHLSYIHYVVLLSTSFLGKILVLPAMGRFAYRFGTRRLLWMGGIGIIPVSGLWLYVHEFWQLMVLQFVAGAVWAAYELAMFLLFFETVRKDERTSILTIFNLGNAISLAIGAAIGGLTLRWLGEAPESYLFLFALSSVVRAATLLVLWLVPRAQPAAESVAAKVPLPPLKGPVPEPKFRAAASLAPPATVSAPE